MRSAGRAAAWKRIRPERAKKALRYSVAVSLCISVFVFYFNFFHGDLLAGIFANDRAVILEAADYLKAYAIDCLLTSFLLCFVGYFSGLGKTVFVMAQGILGAFGVRIPVSFAMSRLLNVRLSTSASQRPARPSCRSCCACSTTPIWSAEKKLSGETAFGACAFRPFSAKFYAVPRCDRGRRFGFNLRIRARP